jgi:hypothetical protein
MNFKILYCEDDKIERENLNLTIKEKLSKLNGINLEIKCEDFEQSFIEIKSKYDLLILDLQDENSKKPDTGKDILIQNESQLKIPTVVYTSKSSEVQFFEEDNRKKYSSFLKLLPKKLESYDNLIEFVKGIIINKIPIEKYYKLYNENDVSLKLNIERIGLEHFNYILYQVFEKYHKIIIVKPMPSGWSGAVLFKLLIGSDGYVLKLSKDINSLKDEQEKSEKYYDSFPPQLTIPIKKDKYHSFDKSVFGFLLKSIENSTSLLSYIIEKKDEDYIRNVLNEIFKSENSLSNHYKTVIDRESKEDWSSIFKKLNIGKIELVRNSYIELEVIILKYNKKINLDNFEGICINNKYENLNIDKLLEDKFKKNLVLSHGDFHANNILIQGERPFIIDTGALGYQHWALDITRLLVSIFILGLDKGKIEYFDLERIKYYKEIGENIININPITVEDGDKNKNCLIAINWLLEKIKEIYETPFSLFEYQLGLMKEFLQVSYRKETVPPNKRALALILADICLAQANENVIE